MKELRRNGYKVIRKNAKGFTLVELIVVLMIIAILAALALPALFGFLDNAHKKQVISRAQTALSSTQAALSDIYSSNDNKYDSDKRVQTRINAGSEEGDQTEFTVWCVVPLYDEPVGDEEATKAIVSEIGSYTIGMALYKDYEAEYAAYNGIEWEVFDSEEEALAMLSQGKEIAVSRSKEDNSDVICVWPFEKGDDYALMDDGPRKPDPEDEEDDTPVIVCQKKVRFWDNPDGKAFYVSGDESDTPADDHYVDLIFNQDDRGVISIDDGQWNSNSNEFRQGITRLILKPLYTYIFRYWKLKDGDFAAADRSAIESYIFSNEPMEYEFVAQVIRDPNLKEVATLSKQLFKDRINNTTSGMRQIPTEEYTLEEVKKKSGAKKVDDNETDFSIYAWYSGNELQWWTDALVAYLPADGSSWLEGKGYLNTVDFTGFDAEKLTTAERMFAECKNLKSVNFGNDFNAINLTNMNECFGYNLEKLDDTKNNMEYNLKTVDLSGVKEVGPALSLTKAFMNRAGLTSVTFGEGFRSTKINGSLAHLFYKNEALNQVNLSGWNVGQVTSLEHAFYNCKSLKLVNGAFEGWDLQNVETLFYAFYGCGENTHHESDMHELKTGDKLANIAECFKLSTFTSLDLRGFNVTNVTNMRSFVSTCSELKTLNMTGWRPTKMVNMMEAFRDCAVLEKIDVSYWNLSDVEILFRTFSGCHKAQIITTGWGDEEYRPKNGKLRSVMDMFKDCNSMTGTVDLSGWSTTGLKGDFYLENTGEYTNTGWYKVDGDMANMFSGCSSLQGVSLNGWDITNAKNLGGVFTNCSSLKTLDLGGFTVGGNFTNTFLNGVKSSLETLVLKKANFGAISSLASFFTGYPMLERVDMDGFTAEGTTNISKMFASNARLNTVIMSNVKLGTATDASYIFGECKNLIEVDLSNAEFTALQNATGMFNKCYSLKTVSFGDKLDLGSVTTMKLMFFDCISLETLAAEKIYTSNNLQSVEDLFKGCFRLKHVYLDNMNTHGTKIMTGMFNMGDWNTTKTIDLGDDREISVTPQIFADESALKEIRLGPDFMPTSVTDANNVGSMFKRCVALETIRVYDGMDITTLTNTPKNTCFEGDTKLKGGAGTVFSSNHTNQYYGCIDGKNGKPGYFTEITQ